MQHAMQGNATPMQYMPIECNNNAIQGNATPGPQCKGRQTMAGYPHARHAHAGHAHARHAYAHGWQCLGFRVWCIRFRPSTGHAYAHAHARPCFMTMLMLMLMRGHASWAPPCNCCISPSMQVLYHLLKPKTDRQCTATHDAGSDARGTQRGTQQGTRQAIQKATQTWRREKPLNSGLGDEGPLFISLLLTVSVSYSVVMSCLCVI